MRGRLNVESDERSQYPGKQSIVQRRTGPIQI
jgi:hypothetical protein